MVTENYETALKEMSPNKKNYSARLTSSVSPVSVYPDVFAQFLISEVTLMPFVLIPLLLCPY